MAFSSEHYLLSFGGPLSTNEQWTCSLRIAAAFGTEDDPAAEEVALDNLEATFRARWAVTGIPMSGDAKLAWMKYNRIGVDGKYVRETTNVVDIAPTLQGSAAGTYPLQIALVATLTTNFERGLAHAGRIFLPSPVAGAIGPNRTIVPASAEQAATWIAGLISAINATEGVGDVIIASSVRDGAQRQVTGVNVGTVLDTMRSRRTSLTEVRSAAPVTTSGTGGTF